MSTDHEVEHSPTMRSEPTVRDPPSSSVGNRHDDLTIKRVGCRYTRCGRQTQRNAASERNDASGSTAWKRHNDWRHSLRRRTAEEGVSHLVSFGIRSAALGTSLKLYGGAKTRPCSNTYVT